MTPRRYRSPILALMMLTFVSGCAAISAVTGATEPLDVYSLRPAEIDFTARQTTSRALVVEEPNTRGALDTDRILIQPNPLQAQYLPRARWADEAPALMQTQILRALEDTGALRYVGRTPLGLSGDYALISELTDFQAELTPNGSGALVRVRLSARLVREEDAAILGSRVFEVAAVAASTDTIDLVAAFDTAAAQVVPEVAAWTLRTMNIPVQQVQR